MQGTSVGIYTNDLKYSITIKCHRVINQIHQNQNQNRKQNQRREKIHCVRE
jgi:hypothetical protein